MKRIALPLSLLIVVLWAIVQPTEILDFSASFLPLRHAFTVLLGALALGWMGFSMLLALRPAWMDMQSMERQAPSSLKLFSQSERSSASRRSCWSSRTGC